MNDSPFTIRIRTEDEQDMDWMVRSEEVTFHQALEVIAQVLRNTTNTAFEYEDEDGDRVTVRSDEEMQSMLLDYFSCMQEEDYARGLLPPLIIYPKGRKNPKERNIHGLTIRTHKQNKPVSRPSPMDQFDSSNTRSQSNPRLNPVGQTEKKKISAQPAVVDIKSILACGTITEDQLQYLEVLGSGNGGRVHRALHKPTGQTMAVKIIELDISPEVQKQIISELGILYKCQSSVIIAFYGAFFLENRISICTEFMDGGSLDKYGQIPEMVLGRIAVFIIQGLLYLRSLKILHRDVKPSNILVSTSGQVKLCDFGVSTQLVQSIANTYIGTNAYMAPERIRGEEYSMPAEVWSLGVSLYELATGSFPFKSNNIQNSPKQILDSIIGEAAAPRLPDATFSQEFVHFVSHCMQKAPVNRLSADQLMEHPFIQQHNDGNVHLIASWVQIQLPQINSISAAS